MQVTHSTDSYNFGLTQKIKVKKVFDTESALHLQPLQDNCLTWETEGSFDLYVSAVRATGSSYSQPLP